MIYLEKVNKEEWVIVHSHKNGSSEKLVLDEIPKTLQRIADILSPCPGAWQPPADEPAIRRNREAERR